MDVSHLDILGKLDHPVDLTEKINESNIIRIKNISYLVNLVHHYHLGVRTNQDLLKIRMILHVLNTRKEKKYSHPERPGRPLFPGGPTKISMFSICRKFYNSYTVCFVTRKTFFTNTTLVARKT